MVRRCGNKIIVALAITVFGATGSLATIACAATQGRPISIEAAFFQKGCPIQLLSATSSEKYLFEHVRVRNSSANTVVAIRFGVVLRVPGSANSKPVFISGVSIPANIKPGEEREIDTYALAIPKAEGLVAEVAGPKVTVELGVVTVEYEDQPAYRYDFEKEGGFRPLASNPSR
jgi:hypothetical protein